MEIPEDDFFNYFVWAWRIDIQNCKNADVHILYHIGIQGPKVTHKYADAGHSHLMM